MRTIALVLFAACHAATPTPAAPTPPAPPKPAAVKPAAIPSDRVDAVLFGAPFVPKSAVAIGVMQDEHGVENKTIVLADTPSTCDQAKAAWGSDRTDTSITMSAIGWKDGVTTTFTGDSGTWSADFDGNNPDVPADLGPARDMETAIGTVTTLHAATAVGGTGRIRFDLRVSDGDSDDHARGEIDVIQCE